MADQIPHLNMDIIARRAADDLGRTEETAEQHYLGAPVPDYRAAVDAVIAVHDRETAAKTLDDLTAWLTDVHERHAGRTAYIPLALLNIERFRADRIGAGDE